MLKIPFPWLEFPITTQQYNDVLSNQAIRCDCGAGFEDPKEAKGVVKREVVQVITGTEVTKAGLC